MEVVVVNHRVIRVDKYS